jgi:hypothetical protein
MMKSELESVSELGREACEPCEYGEYGESGGTQSELGAGPSSSYFFSAGQRTLTEEYLSENRTIWTRCYDFPVRALLIGYMEAFASGAPCI